jgi:hypothetical protein
VARQLRCEHPRLRKLKTKMPGPSTQRFLVELLAFIEWVFTQQEEEVMLLACRMT